MSFLEKLKNNQGCTHIPNDHDLHVLWLYAQKNKGWVYAAHNTQDVSLIKIGYTQKDPFTRAKTLKTAGVVGQFIILKAVQMVDCISAESKAHRLLAQDAVDGEFFRISEEKAGATLQKIWRDERDALRLFKVEWLLHDKTIERFLHNGFDVNTWTSLQNDVELEVNDDFDELQDLP